MVLTFNDTEEKAVEKIITALADSIQIEAIQPPAVPRAILFGVRNKTAPTPGTPGRKRHILNPA